ncbi:glutathione S-transferase kappa 1-like isoform X2 [Ptychodera flava]|uniref:glutathione S-transferase kappa 1-like isoform X2 n=1 Tax=Ptychodera flava TaxID=63121 RepID=UPI00396A80EC
MAAPARRTIELFYDVISPYAWIGFETLCRYQNKWNIDLQFRPFFLGAVMAAVGSLQAQRLLTAVSMHEGNDAMENISRQLYLRVWSKDLDVTQPSSLMEAAQKAGFSEEKAQSLVSRINDQEIKDKLKDNTQTAVGHGAFGAPTIVVHMDDEAHMFFGSDRFHLIADLLGEKYEGPLVEYSKLKM